MTSPPSRPVTGLSSKATQHLLADLAAQASHRYAVPVTFVSGGGVEIARRVREGEHADLLVLAADAMNALATEGLVRAETLRPLFVSQVVLAVPTARADLTIDTETQLLEALGRAGSIAYSTGPSGTALLEWLGGQGILDELRPRLLQAPPGVPVGSLLADGSADLGIQQFSELQGVAGVHVVGPLPGSAAVTSTFSGAVVATSESPTAARVLDFLESADAAPTVTAHGMRPATT